MTDLAFHIRQFVPAAEGAELEHRIALLNARSCAGELVGQAIGDMAYSTARDALDIAQAFVFAEAPAARLQIALQLCRHLVMAAYLADHLEDEGGMA